MENIESEGSGVSVHIDEDECIGCGTCEEIYPEVFRFDTEREKAELI